MKGILADANIKGYVDLIVAQMQGQTWREFWDHLHLRYVQFSDVGLVPHAPDNVVWHACQNNTLYLITDNRSSKSPDSLEAPIRQHCSPTSLPVFTVADVQRLRHSRVYCDQVVETLFEYLIEEDNILGTGRLFLPRSPDAAF